MRCESIFIFLQHNFLGGVRMKYPSAFIVTTKPYEPKENKAKPSPPEKCDRCLGVIVSRINSDNLQHNKRGGDSGDSNSVWSFVDGQNRNNCNCVKVMLIVVIIS